VDENRDLLKLMREVGLLGEPLEKSKPGILGTLVVEVYPVTDMGASFINVRREDPDDGRPIGLCYGERRATAVTEYTEPAQALGTTISRARFQWSVAPVDWATSESAARLLQEEQMEGDGAALFVETSNGWRLEEISWSLED
jgi:hypothetical protein